MRFQTVLASVLAAAALSACGKPEPAAAPPRAVKLITVGAPAPEPPREYAGEVRAQIESRLGFQVAGKLTQRAVEPGQRVQRGQLLAQLDARDYELAAQAARAQLQAASTQRDLAAADVRRFEALRAQGFISAAEMDRRQAQLRSAQAALEQARAQLASQGNQTAYTQLRADADGVITAVDAEPGQVLAAGQPVLRLAREGARDVVFAVPEDQVQALAVGQPVQARLWAGGQTLPARVREVAASADPATRTFAVKASLDEAAGPAPLGATAYVRLSAAAPAPAAPALQLPASALRQGPDGRSSVWLFDAASSTVRSQPVQVAGVGGADGNAVLIASGLQAGMQVVGSGVHVLEEGQAVRVYQPANAASAAATAASPAASAAAR